MASNIPSDNITMPASWRAKAPALLAVGAVCILLSLALFYFGASEDSKTTSWSMFFNSYLANYMFCMTICLGALFFVMVTHLVRAGWMASLRRLAELLAFTIPWWAFMFLPILALAVIGDTALYPWAGGAEKVDALVASKLGYLNPSFFTIRTVIYFAVFIIAARVYFLASRRQDESGDAQITLKLQRWAGPFIMLFALAVNFAAFDWMMSTDPAWFSTIYGVYIFAASMLSFFATMILLCHLLQRSGRIEKLVTIEHFHDLSKFQHGFIVFWSYIAFSQFLLYWYGNIPEETLWYKHRMEHGWGTVGLILIAVHFVIPFLGTMSRHVRRKPAVMAGWAVYILAVHWLDMMFLIMPNNGFVVSGMLIVGHLACWVGMVAVFVALFLMRVGETPVVAVKDPWLPDALSYHVGP
ncbi:MAG TPA: quinol:cytochrome C oxidoreductase [Planctomycetaceae bacterium]|nr:quinol:cytochrome C oxidoreductase [Planctomycetaceae bacterium]